MPKEKTSEKVKKKGKKKARRESPDGVVMIYDFIKPFFKFWKGVFGKVIAGGKGVNEARKKRKKAKKRVENDDL